MEFRKWIVVLVVFLFALAPAVSAGTILVGVEDLFCPNDWDWNDIVFSLTGEVDLRGSGGMGWQTMPAPNNAPPPYWDTNTSWDWPSGQNIGHFVAGTGVYASNPLSPHWANAEYWGPPSGGFDPSTYFDWSGGTVVAQYMLEASAFAPVNSVYWRSLTNPGNWNLLFPGSAIPGSIASFNPGGDFFISYISPVLVNSQLCDNGGRMAFFREAPVPEPSTYALLGAGLIGLAFLRRKRRV